MPDLTAIAAALSSLKAAKDIAEAMIGLRDTEAFQGKLLEFQSKLIDANNAAFMAQEERSAMLEKIRDLEKQVADLKAWESDKQRYDLVSLAPNVVACAPKETMRGSEPSHYLCANCFATGKKSYLQQKIQGPYAKNSCPSTRAFHRRVRLRRAGAVGWVVEKVRWRCAGFLFIVARPLTCYSQTDPLLVASWIKKKVVGELKKSRPLNSVTRS